MYLAKNLTDKSLKAIGELWWPRPQHGHLLLQNGTRPDGDRCYFPRYGFRAGEKDQNELARPIENGTWSPIGV
jgi:hypothetical protein